MIQLSFLNPGPSVPVQPSAPFVRNSRTSKAAAEAIKPHLNALRGQVWQFIRDCGDYGATDPEICEGLGLRPDTARARRCELRDAGLVVDSGKRRSTSSGRAAVVWVTTCSSAEGATP